MVFMHSLTETRQRLHLHNAFGSVSEYDLTRHAIVRISEACVRFSDKDTRKNKDLSVLNEHEAG